MESPTMYSTSDGDLDIVNVEPCYLIYPYDTPITSRRKYPNLSETLTDIYQPVANTVMAQVQKYPQRSPWTPRWRPKKPILRSGNVIPEDVLALMFRYLSPVGLHTCLRVNRYFYLVTGDILYHADVARFAAWWADATRYCTADDNWRGLLEGKLHVYEDSHRAQAKAPSPADRALYYHIRHTIYNAVDYPLSTADPTLVNALPEVKSLTLHAESFAAIPGRRFNYASSLLTCIQPHHIQLRIAWDQDGPLSPIFVPLNHLYDQRGIPCVDTVSVHIDDNRPESGDCRSTAKVTVDWPCSMTLLQIYYERHEHPIFTPTIPDSSPSSFPLRLSRFIPNSLLNLLRPAPPLPTPAIGIFPLNRKIVDMMISAAYTRAKVRILAKDDKLGSRHHPSLADLSDGGPQGARWRRSEENIRELYEQGLVEIGWDEEAARAAADQVDIAPF